MSLLCSNHNRRMPVGCRPLLFKLGDQRSFRLCHHSFLLQVSRFGKRVHQVGSSLALCLAKTSTYHASFQSKDDLLGSLPLFFFGGSPSTSTAGTWLVVIVILPGRGDFYSYRRTSKSSPQDRQGSAASAAEKPPERQGWQGRQQQRQGQLIGERHQQQCRLALGYARHHRCY